MQKAKFFEYIQRGGEGRILILGKSDYFSDEEIDRFLKLKGFEVIRDYNGEELIGAIESRTLNMKYEMISERAYEDGIKHYPMSELEKLISKSLKINEILMSIKLSKDMDRVVRLLQNEYISDEMFLRLLDIYEWESREVHGSDRDRYVYWALLERFLELSIYEKDALYSPSTILKLIDSTDNSKLLDIISKFPPFSYKLRGGHTITIQQAISMRDIISQDTIKRLLKRKERGVDIALASNRALDNSSIKYLFDKNDSNIDEALAINLSIDDDIFEELFKRGSKEIRETMMQEQRLTKERVETILRYLEDEEISLIGKNRNIDNQAIERLLEIDSQELHRNLAKNSTIDSSFIERFYKDGKFIDEIAQNPSTPIKILKELYEDSQSMLELAKNPSTPQEILEELYQIGDFSYYEALASNPSTPMSILHQLKTDHRLWLILQYNQKFVEEANQEMGMR